LLWIVSWRAEVVLKVGGGVWLAGLVRVAEVRAVVADGTGALRTGLEIVVVIVGDQRFLQIKYERTSGLITEFLEQQTVQPEDAKKDSAFKLMFEIIKI
jgi:hypothetical protein